MTRLRHGAIPALVAGVLAIAAPASGAIAVEPPDPALAPAAVTAGSGPVSVAVVVPLTAPPTTTGVLDAESLTTYTEQGGILDRELDAVSGTRAAIGLDPMIPASIRLLGSAAPPEALLFLERLRALPNETFLLSYADADPATAVLAGATAELSPLGFHALIDPGNFGPAVTADPTPGTSGSPTPAPTPPADPGDPPPLPTSEDLLAWPVSLPEIAWPAEGTVTADGLAGLAALGYADVLLGAGNLPATGSALVDTGAIDALAIDDAVSSALRDSAYAATETAYAAASVTLEAALRASQITSPGRTIVATLDRRWPFGTLRLPDALAAIEQSDAAQLVSLSAVLSGPRVSASLVEPDAGAAISRGTALGELTTAARAEQSYLAIAEGPQKITEPRRLALLGLSSVGWRTDEEGWAEAVTTELEAAQATLDAVQIADGSDQLLLSDVSSLKLQVSNALPVPVTVLLVVRPLQPLLHVEDPSVEVTIEPDSTSSASVPVESITNGEVTVRAELHSAGGAAVGSPRFLKVILQAGWETVGTVIAGALIVLVFGGGLVRSILRRRREQTADAHD
jgi:hypothetical protein